MSHKNLAALFFLLLFVGIVKLSTPSKIETPSEGNVLFFSNQTGHDLTKTIMNAIDSAKKSITISIFNISDINIISALNKKAEEGVEIFLFTDAHASWPGLKKLHKAINKHLWKTTALMHQKILIIDKKEIYLGSANFTWNSLNIHRNLILAFSHSESAEFLLNHLEATDFNTHFLEQKKTLFIGHQEAEILMFPSKTDWSEKIFNLIHGAKKCIKVAMYTWTRSDFAHSLVEAKLKGIDVEIVLDRSVVKRNPNPVVDTLLKASIQTYVYQGPGLLHHKFLWIDDETLLSGSANWTQSAFTKNREYIFLLNTLTHPQKKIMDTLWKALKSESKVINSRMIQADLSEIQTK